MTDELSAVDREALTGAIALTLAETDQSRVEQVRLKLREDPWWEVATFCAYHRQMAALKLQAWEIPPCWISETDIADILATGSRDRRYDAAELGQRLLAAGKSLWEPDPLAALGEMLTAALG
jgi:hypothetical protein